MNRENHQINKLETIPDNMYGIILFVCYDGDR